MNRRISLWSSFVALAAICCAGLSGVASNSACAAEGDAKLYQTTVDKGINYLLTKGEQSDGSYGTNVGPGVAAICTTAVLKHGRSPDDPAVARSLKYLEKFIHDDGGIYSPGSPVQNYETCLAVQCFAAANADGRYAKQLKNAEEFLKHGQFGGEPADFNYGGSGYAPPKEGKKQQRPDLSNTGFLLDALKATGEGPDDEAVKRALVFVSRCQNLETEHNATPFAAKNPDGGFYYTPAAGGGSDAGKTADGGLRSYGSMTYTGLKSMIFAGVKADDPRVKAAVDWIKKNYTLAGNPGLADPSEGAFYFYHTFAKALNALGQNVIVDSKGVKHDWRHDLLVELAKRQHEDGSWTNTNEKFLEGNANVATAFAMLSLAYANPDAKAEK